MIRGKYQKSDVLSAQWVHLRPRPGLFAAGVVLLGLFGLAAGLALFGTSNGEPTWARWMFLGIIVYFAASFGLWLPYRTNKTYEQRRDLHREVTFSPTDAGLEVASENVQGVKPWTDYLKWKEGKKVFLLYMSDNMFQILPKHFFATAEEIVEFRALLNQKVPRGEA